MGVPEIIMASGIIMLYVSYISSYENTTISAKEIMLNEVKRRKELLNYMLEENKKRKERLDYNRLD